MGKLNKLISETAAAKRTQVHKAQRFYQTFVLEGIINPIIFPGEERRRYLEHEVDMLAEKCKVVRGHCESKTTRIKRMVERNIKN